MSRTRLPSFALLLGALSCAGSDPKDPSGGGAPSQGGGGRPGGGASATPGGTTGTAGTTTPATGGSGSSTGGRSTAGGGAVVGSGGASGSGGSHQGGSIGTAGSGSGEEGPVTPLKISENKRYFTHTDGRPFFWLGDTAWLLLVNLNRDETEIYLEDRRKKGFNAILIMVLVNISTENRHGDSPFTGDDITAPLLTEGKDPSNAEQYDWWDHADYVVDLAASKGMHMGLVPMWGDPWVPRNSAAALKTFSEFLGNRYKDRPNIVWLNGGDRPGDYALDKWKTIGEALNQTDANHLITYHPRNQQNSSTWFHNEAWLDFNMFQSGHYDQSAWTYVNKDYALMPTKPTLDGEPAYEGMPEGLRGSNYWVDSDVRRNAYWSVFAGAAGHTYGHNAIWQFPYPGYPSKFGAKGLWNEAIKAPGSGQMLHLKTLMLSRPYLDRVPDQSLVTMPGTGRAYLTATRGANYAFVYTYTGRTLEVAMGKISGTQVKASWFDPRTGMTQEIGSKDNAMGTTQSFDPPGEEKEGNDWVLVLDSM